MSYVPVTKGYYLLDNPPVRDQFRSDRRDPPKPVIVMHTAESGTTRANADPKAENVANFIRTRTDAGSYHLLGDADSIVRLMPFDHEAYQDRTGSNRWAVGISLAVNAADWGTISEWRFIQLHKVAAQMAVMVAMWHVAHGRDYPAPVLLTKEASDAADASGFISHARRDPGRRGDPGAGFDWQLMFDWYEQYLVVDGIILPVPVPPEPPVLPEPPVVLPPEPGPDPEVSELEARLARVESRILTLEQMSEVDLVASAGKKNLWDLDKANRPAKA